MTCTIGWSDTVKRVTLMTRIRSFLLPDAQRLEVLGPEVRKYDTIALTHSLRTDRYSTIGARIPLKSSQRPRVTSKIKIGAK